MTRDEVLAKFRAEIASLPKWLRRAIARAVRRVGPEALEHAVRLDELVELFDVELAHHEEDPPTSSLPPDKEGDEELLERRGKLLSGWRNVP